MEERTTCRQYDSFAADYHWLFSGVADRPFLEEHEELLEALGPGARILDCACGIGIDAVALAHEGYTVCAADASAGMVAEASGPCGSEHSHRKMRLGQPGGEVP